MVKITSVNIGALTQARPCSPTPLNQREGRGNPLLFSVVCDQERQSILLGKEAAGTLVSFYTFWV